ncbi:MAG: replication-associated recombination protein A, partial [Anaerovibrio sp.]|nr:replication-associated recombination protein A [Anaerovibrio sp.]
MARKDAEERQAEQVPFHLRNAVTKLMKELDYGKDYQYAHDTREKITNMECLPESLKGRSYYHPTNEGLEGRFAQRLKDIKAWKRQHKK